MEYAGFVPTIYGGNVTKFAPHDAVKLIASGKLTFDERVVLHRVGVSVSSGASPNFYEVPLEPFFRAFCLPWDKTGT